MFLDKNDGLLKACSNALKQAGLSKNGLEQVDAQQFLRRLNPEWGDTHIAQLHAGQEGSFYLPWTIEPDESPYGIRIYASTYNELTTWTLTPDYQDIEDLRETQIDELPFNTHLVGRLAAALRESDNKISAYTKHFPGVIYQQRKDLSFSYISPTCQERLGFDPTKFQKHGSDFLDLIMPKDQDYYLEETEKHLDKNEPFSLTYRIKHTEDDRVVYILDVRTPITTNSGLLLGFEGVWLDVTRQEIAEKRLTSADWKESLSSLTSGLLHDFKNSITGIRTLVEIYSNSISPEHRWFEGMKMIHQSAMGAQNIVQRIIDLNREEFGKKSYFNMRDLIKEQIDLLRFLLPKHMKIEPVLEQAEIPIYIDEVGFRQLILNLFINARDASNFDGRIGITLKHVHADEYIFKNTLEGSLPAPSDGALIEVIDYGNGISPDHLPKIFNPFFTTKEVSKGSGLGLYNAKLFIDDHGGRIGVYSEIEKGTVISLFIPSADFTETNNSLKDWDEEEEEFSVERHKIAVFAQTHSNDFAENLRKKDCEVIVIEETDRLLRFIEGSNPPPRLLVILSPTICKTSIEVITKVAAIKPDLRIVHIHPPIQDTTDLQDYNNVFELESLQGDNDKRVILQLLELMR